MQSKKPELIVFSQNLMGGGSSFHRNMLSNNPDDFFDVKCIYLDPLHWEATRLKELKLNENDLIFQFGQEDNYAIAKKLSAHISDRKGVIVANLPEELASLNYFPKPNKTVYFICHDKGFLGLTNKYEHLIDVFIAHNYQVYLDIIKLMPNRKRDIHFIQHGVTVEAFEKQKKSYENLNVVFLARHVKLKGIYDLPKIDDELLQNRINVNWSILGDGEERDSFMECVKHKKNFNFKIPENTEQIIEVLKKQDIYILPSSHDGLPVSMLEAMSVGCVPIIYNFSEGIKKVVTNEIGTVVAVGDVVAISKAIANYHIDRNLLFELSNNCILKVKKEFDIKKQAEAYFKLYKNYEKLKNRKTSSLKYFLNRNDHYYLGKFCLRVLNKLIAIVS